MTDPAGLVPRALRDIRARQAAGRFTLPDAGMALSAVAGRARAVVDVPAAPGHVVEATVDQLAEAGLRLVGVPTDEAARLIALPSGRRAW